MILATQGAPMIGGSLIILLVFCVVVAYVARGQAIMRGYYRQKNLITIGAFFGTFVLAWLIGKLLFG